MKNLFAIPRLSLSETFTILITLVVCLVGFTNAEVYSNHRKRSPNQRENEKFLLQKASFGESVPYSHETPKISDELEEKNFARLRNLPESSLEKLFKRHSDYFGESEEADSEKDGDGYGYDDDEYYHFNFKRNDDNSGGNENIKSDKEAAGESNDKDAPKNDKSFRDPHKDVKKETETIEMLNFEETHTGGNGGIKTPNKKKFSDESHQKQSSGESSSSLKMSDLRENSAIDEKLKERKDSGGALATDQKSGDSTNEAKSDDKDVVKLRDVKLTDDSEKKEKESHFKDEKETVSSKNLKEASRVSEEKEKNVKLKESDKFEGRVDKMEAKIKEPTKVSKDEEGISNYSEKLKEGGLSELNSRASFDSNDYKDTADGLKIAGADEEEKNSYEVGGMDKTIGPDDYQGIKQPRDRTKKQYQVRESRAGERASNYRDDEKEAFQDDSKVNELLSSSHDYDISSVNPKEFFKKSQFWKDVGLWDGRSRQQQKTSQDQISQEPQEIMVQTLPQGQTQNSPGQDSIFDMGVSNPFGVNLPRTDADNGDYHKNYIKSLKRFRSFSEDSRDLPNETTGSGIVERSGYDRAEDRSKARRSMPPGGTSEGKAQNKNSNKRDTQENPSNRAKQHQVYTREYEQFSPLKSSIGESTLSEGKNKEYHGSSRLRRKSPQKFEYEIKVINQNKDDPRGLDKLSHYTPNRVEKDVKSKLAIDDKYLKKYPYSQVSRDDLTRLNKMKESEKYGKNKRKAPIVKRHDQKSNIQTRAVPLGYYGNRVKFGQKSYNRNNEKIIPERSRLELNSMVVPFVGGQTAGVIDLNQRSREGGNDDFKHDTTKRFDDSGSQNKGNSLLLVKKDERVTKSFDEGPAVSGSDNDYTSDALAKILAKDNDFLILKRTESNKFQRVSDAENKPTDRVESVNSQLNADIKFGPVDSNNNNNNNNLKPSSKQGLQAKSVPSEKDDKKYVGNLHGTNSKSNLKKTLDKFRDLAGFFKDNEQESADNPMREVKEGRDIVFSEDKLPDPIVISSDPDEKFSAYKTKPQNSIYSISTNFKALDQQEKRKELRNNLENHNPMFTSAGKTESSEYTWEPALRNMFPEAQTVNSTSRNGNEIIVLDLNRNQLRRCHAPGKQTLKQPYAPFGSTAQLPNNNNQYPTTNQYPGTNQYPTTNPYPMTPYPVGGNQFLIPSSRRIQIVLDDGGFLHQDISGGRAMDKNSHQQHSGAKANEEGKGYTVLTSGENQAKIILPFSDVNNFSTLIKDIFDKKGSSKVILKKSADGCLENNISETYSKFLKDLSELSDVREKEGKKESISDSENPSSEKLYADTVNQFPSGEEDTIKYLGDLLQKFILNEPQAKGNKDQVLNEESLQYLEDSNPVSSGDGTDSATGHWSSVDEKGREVPSIVTKEEGYAPKAEDTVGLLQSETSTNEKNPEDELWDELAAASDKSHRLRREGKGKRKRKALSLRERHQGSVQNALPDSDSVESQPVSDSNFLDSKQSEGSRDEDGNDLNMVAKLRGDEGSKETSDIKNKFETHLKELIEGLNAYKNQKEQLFVPNESAWSRKKRKDTRRRKRSTWSDVKNKVSTTAVQNTILKNLAEDNYHSVYSPGIKRRLLSTDIEAEDADSYSDENERDKNVIAEEPQAKGDVAEEKNRARRSLTSEFHSDFKREIDLDESMPNDFQNFLVTSLGAFGSQKREVVKKDEALGEGKETLPDNYNRGKEATEDSALEKREVSSDDNQNVSNYKKYYNPDGLEGSNPVSKPENPPVIEDQPHKKIKTFEALDELPTQIRIQVTNASGKEKKSLKPIMEDSETTFADMESEPKDNEFFEKSNPNPFRNNNLSKFHHYSLNRYNYKDFSGDSDQQNGALQASYQPYRRRVKKKKYNSDPSMKPLNDFLKFDHKPVDSFHRRVQEEPTLLRDHTTQKSAVSNHLPQVETVYNPTQGTNKAQLETTRITKVNSINNKNTVTARTIDSVEGSRIKDGFLKSYLKEHAEQLKCNKMKDFDDSKSSNSNLRLGQEYRDDLENLQSDSLLSPRTETTFFYSPYKQKYYSQRRNPPTMNNYGPRSFPKETVAPNNLYDALRLRQEMKNRSGANRDRQNSKPYQRMYHTPDTQLNLEERDKTQTMDPKIPKRTGRLNGYDFTPDKKPFAQWPKTKEYFTPPLQTENQIPDSKLLLSNNYVSFKSNPLLDALEGLPMDSSKEQDYPDGLEDDYGDDDLTKEGQFDDLLTDHSLRKSNLFEDPPELSNKNPDVDDMINEEEEEIDEDYEENSEEDDPDEYMPLTDTKPFDVSDENSPREGGEFYSGFETNPLSTYSSPSPKGNLPGVEDKFPNPESNVRLGSEAKLKDMRSDSELIPRSSNVLRKLNENSDILGENVLQHVHGVGYGDIFLGLEKIHQPEISKGDVRLKKRKLDSQLKKRNREPPEIGSRFIYAAKNKIRDSNAPNYPTRLEHLKTPRNNYRLTKEHFLDAQFAGSGNDYENESEEKGKYFNQINFAKHGFSQKASGEESDETEDVRDNLEDDGETISEDNILENVIGKYIMRKTVKASTDQASKRSANKEKSRENCSVRHDLQKRSAEFSERVPKAKVLRRWLSSGHLTENNFRKYHKKNLTRKRQVHDLDALPPGTFSRNPSKRESQIQSKRSALDLLKKLTSKDRYKKGEILIDSRTAGFEPLSRFNEKKLGTSPDSNRQDKKFDSDSSPTEVKNNLADSKVLLQGAGYTSKESLTEKKKNKAAISGSSSRVQGPWKVELDDKCGAKMSDVALKNIKKGGNKLAEVRAPSSAEEPKSPKGFLVIGKNSKALTSASGSRLKEAGGSGYRPNPEEGRGTSKKYIWKRYLKPSADRMKGDYAGDGKASGELNDKEGEGVNGEETNRALHDTESFAEGVSSQPSQGLQRNSKMSFVTADDQSKTSRFFSKGRLVKRKSAFPPSNDANILKDSRHVKEETSEYLGQQAVNAILSHVSANPRFKEMIAPGLAPRTPDYKQENLHKDNTLQKVDFPDHLQYFLQRFMYDLEKLAERRVKKKKRMCSQIDKQAKQFLEFLLAVPTENVKPKCGKEDIYPIPGVLTTVGDEEREPKIHFYNGPTPEGSTEPRTKAPPSQDYTPEFTTQTSMSECPPDHTEECKKEHGPKSTPPPDYQQDFSTEEQKAKSPSVSESSYKDLKAEIENLRKKCCLLLKLIVDYQNLSKLEKEVLDSKYHNIMQQLDRISQEIKGPKGNQEDTPENQTPADENYLCCGYNLEKNPQHKNYTESNSFQTTTEIFRGSTNSRNQKPKLLQKKKLPKLYFEEMKNPAELEVSTTTRLPVFERVSVGKLSELRKEAKEKPSSFEIMPPTTLAPNSFDLLLCPNDTTATNDSTRTMTSPTYEPTSSTPFSNSPFGISNATEGDGLTMLMNSISAINSGSNLHPQYVVQQMQERKKRKKFAPHLPGRRKKRSNRKGESEFKKPESSAKRSDYSYEEEYTGWSSMPVVRRMLNNLESGFEFDDIFFQKPKRRKLWRRGEKKPD